MTQRSSKSCSLFLLAIILQEDLVALQREQNSKCVNQQNFRSFTESKNTHKAQKSAQLQGTKLIKRVTKYITTWVQSTQSQSPQRNRTTHNIMQAINEFDIAAYINIDAITKCARLLTSKLAQIARHSTLFRDGEVIFCECLPNPTMLRSHVSSVGWTEDNGICFTSSRICYK